METFLFCILTMVVILWAVLIDRDMQIKKAELNGFGGIGYFGETNKYDAFQKCKKIIQSCETYRQLIKTEIVNKSFKKLYDDSFLNGELSNLYDKKRDEIIKKEITELKIHVPLSSKDEDIRKFMQYIEKQAKAYEFNLPNRGYDIYAFTKDILYWLEKQCDNKEGDEEWEVTTGLYKCTKRMFDSSPESRLLFEVGNLYKCVTKYDVAEFESSYGHSVFLIDPVVRKHFIKVKDTIEKQDDQSSETYH